MSFKHTSSEEASAMCKAGLGKKHFLLLQGQGEDLSAPTGKELYPSSNLSSTLSQALTQTAPFVHLNKQLHSYRKSEFEKIRIFNFRKHSNGR